MNNTRLTILLIILCAVFNEGKAQTIASEYQAAVADFLPIYSGKGEYGYYHGYKSTPYWPQEYTKGDITFRGITYEQVNLILDTYKQNIIVLSPDGRRRIEVARDQITNIKMNGTELVWQQEKDGAPKDAFYEMVYCGKNENILRLHYVDLPSKIIEDRRILFQFKMRDKMFLNQNGKWTELKRFSSFIKCHHKDKEKLMIYCKDNELHPENDNDWKSLASYCETLGYVQE